MTKPKLDGANTPLVEQTLRGDAILTGKHAHQADNLAKITRLREALRGEERRGARKQEMRAMMASPWRAAAVVLACAAAVAIVGQLW